MPIRRIVLPALFLLFLPSFAAPVVFDGDPPSRAARLNFYEGSLSFKPASLDDWEPVNRNYPLTIGDEVWADDGSRGEIHVGGGTVVRLGPGTAFSFLNLADDTAQMRLTEGSLALTVSRLDDDEVIEVATPNAAVTLLRPGSYRIDVDERRYETMVTVRQGEAEVIAGGAALPVLSSEALVISGEDADPRYDIRAAGPLDAWEEWALERDRREERFESRRYVSDDMVGYEDLDEYGSWRDDATYGRVWAPSNLSADWAPYRYGHWAYVQPWGWSWIDDAPWGFAPSHYGRWGRSGQGWFWVPGSLSTRPVYAPALVGFLDDSALSIGGGGLGWFPLGPSEVYVPPYRVSQVYIRNVNAPYVPNIAQIAPNLNVSNVRYVNQGVPGAVTAVSRDTFVGGRNVAKAVVAVPQKAVQQGKARSNVVENLKPRRESVMGASAARATVRRPPARAQRPVVVRTTPPSPPPRISDDGRRASSVSPSVKPAVREGKGVNLRPMREGLPAPREVRAGERPRARGREAARPAQPTLQEPRKEPSKAREPERERRREPVRESPPAARPEEPRPPVATPSPVTQPREPARPEDRERARQRREPERESPPAARPEAAKPPAVSPPPAAQPRQPEKPAERERARERREPPRESPAAVQPDAPKPSPGEERVRERDRSRERPPAASPAVSPSPEAERPRGAKPKGKPTPKPTPTPTPE